MFQKYEKYEDNFVLFYYKKNIPFSLVLSLKSICNLNDIMVKRNVVFSKENIFFEVIHVQHRR